MIDAGAVVHAFERIDERAAHQGDFPGVGGHFGVGADHIDGQLKHQLQPVARRPGAGKGEVTVLRFLFQFPAVERGAPLAAPGGNADAERETPPGDDLEADVPLIRVASGDFDFDAVGLHGSRRRNVAAEFSFALRPAQPGELRQKAAVTGRAAGAVEPRLAHRADVSGYVKRVVNRQQIGIEELAPVERNSGKRVVVKRLLHHVGVTRFAGGVRHAAGELDQRHRGAALGVGGFVRQVVIDGEGFADPGRAAAAGQVHASVCDAVEEGPAGVEEGVVAGTHGDVGHADIEVERAHRVAHRIGLLADRLVGLPVVEVPLVGVGGEFLLLFQEKERLFAAFVHEVAGEFEVLGFAGGVGQLAEGEFELFVAGVAVEFPLFGAEHGRNVVGIAAERIEELAAAGGAEVGDGGLGQVPGAVKFVPVEDVFPTVLRRDHGEVGVEIAVRPLGGDDQIDVGFELVGQRLVFRILGEHERHAFEHLGEVGIPEDVRHIRHARLPFEAEGVDPPGFPALFDGGRNCRAPAGGDALREDRVAQPDGGGVDRRERFHFQQTPWVMDLRLIIVYCGKALRGRGMNHAKRETIPNSPAKNTEKTGWKTP